MSPWPTSRTRWMACVKRAERVAGSPVAARDEGAQIIDEPVDATAGSPSLGDRALEPRVLQATQQVGDVLTVKHQFRLRGQPVAEEQHRRVGERLLDPR